VALEATADAEAAAALEATAGDEVAALEATADAEAAAAPEAAADPATDATKATWRNLQSVTANTGAGITPTLTAAPG